MISVADARRGVLEAIDRYVNSEPTADGVLRRSATVLRDRIGYPSVSVARPGRADITVGGPSSEPAVRLPIEHRGEPVGELCVGGADADDRAFLEHVARMLSSRCER